MPSKKIKRGGGWRGPNKSWGMRRVGRGVGNYFEKNQRGTVTRDQRVSVSRRLRTLYFFSLTGAGPKLKSFLYFTYSGISIPFAASLLEISYSNRNYVKRKLSCYGTMKTIGRIMQYIKQKFKKTLNYDLKVKITKGFLFII